MDLLIVLVILTVIVMDTVIQPLNHLNVPIVMTNGRDQPVGILVYMAYLMIKIFVSVRRYVTMVLVVT